MASSRASTDRVSVAHFFFFFTMLKIVGFSLDRICSFTGTSNNTSLFCGFVKSDLVLPVYTEVACCHSPFGGTPFSPSTDRFQALCTEGLSNGVSGTKGIGKYTVLWTQFCVTVVSSHFLASNRTSVLGR